MAQPLGPQKIIRYEDYADIIEELDSLDVELPGKSPDFIAGLLERKPPVLSPNQVKWLDDLKARYLL